MPLACSHLPCEISQHLLQGLTQNFVQMFVVPRRLIQMTLEIPRLSSSAKSSYKNINILYPSVMSECQQRDVHSKVIFFLWRSTPLARFPLEHSHLIHICAGIQFPLCQKSSLLMYPNLIELFGAKKIKRWQVSEFLYFEVVRHLIRMPPGRLPLEAFQARLIGMRPWCRPRTYWRDYTD